MKKKWIAAGTAAGVILLGAVVVFAVKQSSQERVTVISMQEMMGWGGMNDMSMSGNIISDVSQDIYLGSNQVVDEVFVQEGDTVYLGDPLVSYDMTLVNLELEMKKLDREGIQLNIKKAQREITKLKNTKPASDGGGVDDPGFFDDPGMIDDDPGMIEDPGDLEEPEEPAAAYELLDGDSEPYMGEGTLEDPYHFLCSQNGVVLGSFLNRMAQEQCFFLIEVREGDLSNGELLKVWGQKITDPDLNLDPDARFEMKLSEIEEIAVENTKVFDVLTGSDADQYCKGDGSAEKPYTYLISADGVVKGSFFDEMRERKVNFRLEVWKDNVYGGTLMKAWEQDGEVLGEFADEDEYLVGLASKEPGEDDGDDGEDDKPEENPGTTPSPEPSVEPEPTETPDPEVSPSATPEPTPEPTSEPEPTPEPTQGAQEGSGDAQPDASGQSEETPINSMASSAVYTRIIPLANTVDGVMDDSMGGMSKEEIQKQIKEKEAEIRGYQLDLKEADLEIKKIQKDLNNQTIRSTINGVVKTVEDPEQVGSTGKPLIQVVSSEGLYVRGTISESKLDELEVGDKLNGFSYETGVSFTAEVREISPYPLESSQGTDSSYPFTAYIENADGLKNYSYVELTLAGEDGTGSGSKVTVEKPFVRTEDGQYYVMIDDGSGHLKKQVVQISRIIWGSTYEISDGLSWNDKIAFPYGKNAVEGAKTEEGTWEDLYR